MSVRIAANDWTPLCRSSNSENRRVEPENVNGRKKFKVVYVVLESQYQASMTVACKRINAAQVISILFPPLVNLTAEGLIRILRSLL